MAFPKQNNVERALHYIFMNPDIGHKFLRKVRKFPGGCWHFVGAKGGDSYGYFFIPDLNLQVAAHRFSYLLHCGRIPDGMLVLHECDNKVCVNPEHLFAGTWKDNMVDKTNKGRNNAPAGMRNAGSILSDSDVKEIMASSDTVVQLSQRFGVNRSHISAIRCGHAWRHLQHLNDRPKPNRNLPKGATLPKLMECEVLEMRDLYKTGDWTYRDLGREFGVSEITAANVCKRRNWKHI